MSPHKTNKKETFINVLCLILFVLLIFQLGRAYFKETWVPRAGWEPYEGPEGQNNFISIDELGKIQEVETTTLDSQ